METLLDIGRWAAGSLLIPLACSLYASLIVVRYVDFVQLRGAASHAANDAKTHFLYMAMMGQDKYRHLYSRDTTKSDPLFRFGRLHAISVNLDKKGHKRASKTLKEIEERCILELHDIFETGAHTEEQLTSRFFLHDETHVDEIPQLKPSLWALLTVFRWNI